MESSSEHANEPMGSIKFREFLNYLRNYRLLKDFTPWGHGGSIGVEIDHLTDVGLNHRPQRSATK